MRLPKSRVLWATVLCLSAGAGVSVSSRIWGSEATELRLVLNIPASRLDVYENEAITRSFDVSVGRRGFETPAGKYKISRVVWNPWWHPPDSKWARGMKPAPPGPQNPMGRVKLQFANLLYIHGTTEENRLGAPASHGCVRMANGDLVELTKIVHRYTTRDLPEEVIATLEASPKQTRTFYLRKSVPLAVQYEVVEVRDGNVVIHPDVYRQKGTSIRELVVAALEKEGVDVATLDSTQLETLSKRRNATRLTMSIDTLLARAGGASGR
jgi:murein L,D-transpeptidase YcbB/YkuD